MTLCAACRQDYNAMSACKVMPAESYDRDKVVECMFDNTTSLIIAELEGGGKSCTHLADVASVSEDDVLERLSYLIEWGFVIKRTDSNATVLEADFEKLTEIIEDGDNFGAAVDGLAKMDSYLN